MYITDLRLVNSQGIANICRFTFICNITEKIGVEKETYMYATKGEYSDPCTPSSTFPIVASFNVHLQFMMTSGVNLWKNDTSTIMNCIICMTKSAEFSSNTI